MQWLIVRTNSSLHFSFREISYDLSRGSIRTMVDRRHQLLATFFFPRNFPTFGVKSYAVIRARFSCFKSSVFPTSVEKLNQGLCSPSWYSRSVLVRCKGHIRGQRLRLVAVARPASNAIVSEVIEEEKS